MTQREAGDVREYYRLITEVDIGDVARELLAGRIVEEAPARLFCDCPNHQSISHRSLHIRLDVQSFICFGCSKGGDVLQLVEFVQSGGITAGQSGEMPESHRKARDWLAERAGLPPLAQYGLTPAQIAEMEQRRAFETRVQEALSTLAAYYHFRLKQEPEVLAWLQSKYAITADTIDRLQIGYAANKSWKDKNGEQHAGVMRAMTGRGFSNQELAATGAFVPTQQGKLFPFFDRRLIFPYWSRGRVAFLIGRKTPWTPDNQYEKGKYKKLPVHNTDSRRYIAPCIDNGVLYNEDCLLARPSRLVITEGVTDCIALMQAGFPTISPVTVQIRANDWDRIIPKLRGVETVYICQDNELSEAGLKGALRTAGRLSKAGIETRIVTLPLGSAQEAAREQLRGTFGLEASPGPGKLKELLKGRSAEDIAEAERLLGEAKIDVNDFFAAGKTAEDFEELLATAKAPIEFAIATIPEDAEPGERDKLLAPVLEEVARRTAIEQTRLLKAVQDRFGKTELPLTVLREHVKGVQRNVREQGKHNAREERVRAKRSSMAPSGSCLAAVETSLIETELALGAPDYAAAAEAAFAWFREHGAMFFRTSEGRPFLCFDNDLYWMDSNDRGRRRKYAALMLPHTGMLQTTNGGRSFFDAIASLAVIHGQERDHLSWLHTDIMNQTVWFNLNNKEHEIVRISPEGVTVMKNGSNPDQVILGYSNKMDALHFLVDADLAEADKAISGLLADNFSCAPGDRFFILSWLSCFLLMDFAGTKPMTRFEGPSGSGKTTAAKLITALLYGRPQQKIATIAANYTDGSQNPLLALDNIEVQQMTDGLTEFMLTSITGVAREKRKGGTDSENVSEYVKCLLNTTGIEPLRGDLSEILSRTFTVEFDDAQQASACFLDAEVVAAIQQKRDLILSAVMKRTSHVLAMIRDGKRRQVLTAMQQTLGAHDKRRCNDYLSLMYLMTLAGAPDEVNEPLYSTPHATFINQVRRINATSRETARGANPITAALDALFNAWGNAVRLDEQAKYDPHERAMHVSSFIERYHLSSFQGENRLVDVTAGQLCTAFGVVARQFGINCQYKNAVQLGKRLRNDMEIIQEAGYEITTSLNRTKTILYCIRRLDA